MSTRAELFVRSPELANFATYNSRTTTIKLLLKKFSLHGREKNKHKLEVYLQDKNSSRYKIQVEVLCACRCFIICGVVVVVGVSLRRININK